MSRGPQINLFSCLGSKLDTLTKQQLLEEIEKLAVLQQNNLVKVVNSDKMILHALVRGITDKEIREQVLAKTEELGLEETVKFVEAKETGRRSTVQLSPNTLANIGVNKVTAYKRDQRSDVITKPMDNPNAGARCMYCSRTGHGNKPFGATRKNKCPANGKRCNKCQIAGHFSGSCQTPKPKVDSIKETQFETELSTLQAVSLVDSRGNKYKLSPNDLVPHMVETDGEFKVVKPESQPRIDIEIQVDIAAYKQFGLQCKLGKQFTDRKGRLLEPPKMSMVTDTGAQVDCLSKDKLKCLGLNELSLLKTELSLGCANKTDAGILGAFWGKVVHKANGNNTVVRVLFYVLRKRRQPAQ